MADVTLTADDAAFLAARLRRLFKHFGYQLPEFTEASDASLIRVAGSAIGGLLANQPSGVAVVPTSDTDLRGGIAAYLRGVGLPLKLADDMALDLLRYVRTGAWSGAHGVMASDDAQPKGGA